jgi:putative ABC transport system permease protein
VPKYLAMTLHATPAANGVSYLREQYASPLLLLLALAGAVLLIACANLASLTLARGSAREREVATRLALGASRGRVARQLLSESLLLAAAGTACGFLLARILGDALVAFVDGGQRDMVLNLDADWRVVVLTVSLAVVSALVIGFAPALRATASGPAALMKDAGRGFTGSRREAGWRRVLLGLQIAVALVLLFGASLFARTLRNLGAVDPGFARTGIVMIDIDLSRVTVADDRRVAYVHEIVDRLRAIPGIDGAASTSLIPLSGDVWGGAFVVDTADGPRAIHARLNQVSSGYFPTFDVPLVAGRDFHMAIDTPASPRVAIVNQTLANTFGGKQTIGGRITMEATPSQPATTYRIVGVAADTKYLSLREQAEPLVYFPLSQQPRIGRRALVAVRGRLDTAATTASAVKVFRDLDPDIGASFTVLDSFIDRTLTRERLMATLSVFFGSVAAALAMIGLYGAIAYSVSRRVNEIGVRMALGASREDVVRMVVLEGAYIIVPGVTLGLVLIALSGKVAEALLFGLTPLDPFSIALGTVLLGALAISATYLPARAASRIEPIIAIRTE